MRQIFNPLLESNFQKVEEMISKYTVYKIGTTIFADPAAGSGLAKYRGTDMGAILQSCFSTMGQGMVYVKAGIYYQTTQFTMNYGAGAQGQYLKGEGSYSTFIVTLTDLTLVNCVVGDGVNFYWRGGISDIHFDVSGVKTAGESMQINSGSGFMIDRCTFQNQYDSIKINVAGWVLVRNCSFINNISKCIYITGGATAQVHNCIMDCPTAATYGIYGVYVDSCETLIMSDCHIVRHNTGMRIIPAATKWCRWFFINNCAFDTCSNYGLNITSNAAGAFVQGLYFTACWFSSMGTGFAAGDGIVSLGTMPIEEVRFEGCRIYGNGRYGINWTNSNTTNIAINNSSIVSNNLNNVAGGADGIYFLNVTYELIISNCLVGGTLTNMANNQQYGIRFAQGPINAQITDNDLRNNVVGAIISPAGIGAGTLIRGNGGYNPQPLAAIAIGASPFTYTNNSGCIEQIRTLFVSTTAFDFIRAGVVTGIPFIAAHTMVIDLYPGDAVRWTYNAGVPNATRIPM